MNIGFLTKSRVNHTTYIGLPSNYKLECRLERFLTYLDFLFQATAAGVDIFKPRAQ